MENSLIHPDPTFALWAILLSAATIGVWGEKTSWGSKVSGAVITMLVGFFLSNLRIIPLDAPTYNVSSTEFKPLKSLQSNTFSTSTSEKAVSISKSY